MAEEVNQAFRDAANGPMKGVLAITDTPLVSMDFKGTDVSTTIDAALTMVMGDDMVKVVAWYDNEWGECGTESGKGRIAWRCDDRGR